MKNGFGTLRHTSVRKSLDRDEIYEKFYEGVFHDDQFHGKGKLMIYETSPLKVFKCDMKLFEGNFEKGEHVVETK